MKGKGERRSFSGEDGESWEEGPEEESPEDEGWLVGGEEGWEVDDGVDDGVDPWRSARKVEWRQAEEEAEDVARTVQDL